MFLLGVITLLWTLANAATIPRPFLLRPVTADATKLGARANVPNVPLSLQPSITSIRNNQQLIPSPSSRNTVNGIVKRDGALKIRPASPHAQDIPGSHVNLLCAGYGRSLNTDVVFGILAAAEIMVASRIKQRGPLALVDHFPPLKEQGVELELFPSDRLRWYDLLDALHGVVAFVDTWEAFAFTFEIRWQGYRSLGYGQLRPITK